jgi:uncharacterized protein YfbU (UPF0304 family)
MKLTDGERLILVMLSSICKKLDIRDEIDPEFLIKALTSDKTWAIKWKYWALFESPEEDRPPFVKEVLDILGMWDSIESAYEVLTPTEKVNLKEKAKLSGNPTFKGFDGNNETEHLSTARCFIDDLDLFVEFKGRDLNSHFPVLDSYRRMLLVFERLDGETLNRAPNASELLDILNARIA